MTTEQMKDEAIIMLRGALKKVLAANLAQANDLRLVLDLTDPEKRQELLPTVRGIGRSLLNDFRSD